MDMYRCYCPPLSTTAVGHELELDQHEAHHVRKVLRLRDGEEVELFDGAGRTATGKLRLDGRDVFATVKDIHEHPPIAPHITVATAIPKGSLVDAMAVQLSQTGADTLIPLQTRRSVVTPRESKLDRLQKVIIESAKQNRRAHLMQMMPMQNLESVLAMPAQLRILASPSGRIPQAAELAQVSSVLILIGPEGGWDAGEEDAALAAGAVAWQIGPHVMRIETAAPVATALVRHLAASAAQSNFLQARD